MYRKFADKFWVRPGRWRNQPAKGWLCLSSLLGLLMFDWFAWAQVPERLHIMGMDNPAGNQHRLTFFDTLVANTNYQVFFSPVLPATNWLTLPDTRVETSSNGVFIVSFPVPGHGMGCYRLGGELDSDGDALSDVQEAIYGTDPNLPDTDGDGFSDGFEVVKGTDPSSLISQPPIGDLPAVSFTESFSTTSEGAGQCQVPITVSAPFFGTVRYEIAAASTANEGADFQPVSGLLMVAGTAGAVSLSLLDDLQIRSARAIVLDLKADPSGRYRRGRVTRHVIQIEDNDGYWNGVIKDVLVYTNQSGLRTNAAGFGELGFRLKLLRNSATVQASLVSTNPPDQRPQGVGLVPPGEWPMQSFSMGTNFLEALSVEIPVPPPRLFPDADLSRVLYLKAASTNELVFGFNSDLILGEFSEQLVAGDFRSQHLARGGRRGIFVLVREQPPLPPIPTE